ncbi:MAG: hypothetical protein CBE35_01735 [Candidatus Pelagibacter sp. TMED275]|nr:MAG: hypothetical protein CBE35_01735 [Candidatus Pelagibacter sp. TMED275]|tara:strand:- start:236 stop:829 length:594 start_codon:yes stop_codon:yes gene_type:complete
MTSYKYTSLFKIALLLLLLGTFINSCKKGPLRFDPANPQEVPVNAKERAKKNIEEGRGFRLGSAMQGGSGGNFEFASSNPMWRASLDILDFTPLTNVDYSGGVIITDWFNEGSDRSIKISVRFLTNEIRADGLDVSLFEKKCDGSNICQTKKIKSSLGNEIKLEILKKAALIAQEDVIRYKEEHGEYKNAESSAKNN